MLQTYSLGSNIVYFDYELQTIARQPTKSNLRSKGSDNSLYFGIASSLEICNILCKFFHVKKIGDLQGKTFSMKCGYSNVTIEFNINKQGQIQSKMILDNSKDGVMNSLFMDYILNYNGTINGTINTNHFLIILDFLNQKIRFKNIDELCL